MGLLQDLRKRSSMDVLLETKPHKPVIPGELK